MARALFVCLHNAGRSQISAALFEQVAQGAHEARSAGTTPAERVHPEVVEVMREVGIDLSDREPQRLTTELARWADVVVTMGCGRRLPVHPRQALHRLEPHRPKGLPVEQVRAIRDDIAARVRDLAETLAPQFR